MAVKARTLEQQSVRARTLGTGVALVGNGAAFLLLLQFGIVIGLAALAARYLVGFTFSRLFPDPLKKGPKEYVPKLRLWSVYIAGVATAAGMLLPFAISRGGYLVGVAGVAAYGAAFTSVVGHKFFTKRESVYYEKASRLSALSFYMHSLHSKSFYPESYKPSMLFRWKLFRRAADSTGYRPYSKLGSDYLAVFKLKPELKTVHPELVKKKLTTQDVRDQVLLVDATKAQERADSVENGFNLLVLAASPFAIYFGLENFADWQGIAEQQVRFMPELLANIFEATVRNLPIWSSVVIPGAIFANTFVAESDTLTLSEVEKVPHIVLGRIIEEPRVDEVGNKIKKPKHQQVAILSSTVTKLDKDFNLDGRTFSYSGNVYEFDGTDLVAPEILSEEKQRVSVNSGSDTGPDGIEFTIVIDDLTEPTRGPSANAYGEKPDHSQHPPRPMNGNGSRIEPPEDPLGPNRSV